MYWMREFRLSINLIKGDKTNPLYDNLFAFTFSRIDYLSVWIIDTSAEAPCGFCGATDQTE